MVAACLEAMTPLLHTPFVLFGHSLGALLAYEISRIAEPRHLIVSARRIPSAPLGRAPISALPDAEFLAEIDRVYGGVPAAVLKEHDLMEMLLPALRADMQAYEHYTCAADSTPLACPITAFYGTADKTCGAEDAARWRSFTTGQFVLTEFVGPHLFLQTRQAEVLANITRILMR
jgi:surfactin synthase thioesterase subunit